MMDGHVGDEGDDGDGGECPDDVGGFLGNFHNVMFCIFAMRYLRICTFT